MAFVKLITPTRTRRHPGVVRGVWNGGQDLVRSCWAPLFSQEARGSPMLTTTAPTIQRMHLPISSDNVSVKKLGLSWNLAAALQTLAPQRSQNHNHGV